MNQDKSGVFAPKYYSEFRCIADRCRHSCCIDWEICIDGETYDKYKRIKEIFQTVNDCEDGPCFALREDGRCPHLNENGLCNIILNFGENHLSEICRNHPRFYNYINSDRTEAGLGIVCEEACRLILENEEPFSLCRTDEPRVDGELDCEFDALPQRDRIIAFAESEGDFDEKLKTLRDEFFLTEHYSADAWLDRFLSLEIMDADWERDLMAMRGRFLRASGKNAAGFGKYYSRLLSYFVYRHVSVADSEDDLRARLGFAILSVEVIRSLFEQGAVQTLDALIELSRRYSSEIEYSEDNTAELIFAFACGL